nr:MAG TPA: hypothetical protein [Bacteriophage sp.]
MSYVFYFVYFLCFALYTYTYHMSRYIIEKYNIFCYYTNR